jgi:hypothetical protein
LSLCTPPQSSLRRSRASQQYLAALPAAAIVQLWFIRMKYNFSTHANLVIVHGEPNSSFYVIQTNRERIEVIAAIRPSGKRKILG